MRRLSFVFGLLLLPVGCTKPNPASCGDNFCDDPSLPFCDVDGSLAGTPNACIAVSCTPGEFAECRDDRAIACNATGDDYDVSPVCELGCDPESGCITETHECTPGTASLTCGDHTVNRCTIDGSFSSERCFGECLEDPAPHCAYISPLLVPDICDTPASVEHLDLVTLNSDDDISCNGGLILQFGLPAICVVRYGSISVAEGVEARITGRRPIALIADTQLTIAGVLDLSADGPLSGPGGAFRDLDDDTDAGGLDGGGGGGFGTPGGRGGGANGDAGGPIMSYGSGTLRGGSGNRESDNVRRAEAGGGGGAALLLACRGKVTVTGTIDAGGGGGDTGFATQTELPVGGGGGGSGGYVLLEGLALETTGGIFANGGSGGDGRTTRGADATRTVLPAATPTSLGVGHGGAGGAIGSSPEDGTTSSAVPRAPGPGGGGGAVGVIQRGVPAGVTPTGTPLVSPDFVEPVVVPVR